MAPTAEQIVELYRQRKKALDPRIARMSEVRNAVEGLLDIPLPELDRNEKPMVANLMEIGLSQGSQRISSTLPDVRCQPLRPGIQRSEQLARDRRAAILGWWDMCGLDLSLRKRARWYLAYACAPVIIRRDKQRSIPEWVERDPLTTFPPPGDEMCPPDCIFAFDKTLHWLRSRYPAQAAALNQGGRPSPDDRYTIVEYADDEVFVLVVLGRQPSDDRQRFDIGPAPGGRPFVELARDTNLARICPVVIPGRICLDRRTGQFDGLIGLYWWQSRIMALEGIAMERDIFQDEWFIGRPGENPQIITPADGREGIVGEASGGVFDRPGTRSNIPAYQTMDRIERAMRLTGGIPAEYGGESTSNIRTGRRGGQVLSAAVDFGIQEAQTIFQRSLEEENVRAIAIDKAYFGQRRKSFYFSWNGKEGRGEYTPDDVWETDENTVRYSFPGADLNQLIISSGQSIGMGTMSKRRGMELDPRIEDPDLEHARVQSEALEEALLSALQQAAAGGTLPPADLARIVQLRVAGHKPLPEAVMQVHDEAQRRQASTGPPGTPEAPAAPGSPEAQPGLAQAGQGAEAGTMAAPPADLQNLSQLQMLLRRPQHAANVPV